VYRRKVLIGAPLLILALGSCGKDEQASSTTGSSSSTTSTATAAASVTHVVEPDPAPARPSNDPGFEWATSFTVTLTATTATAATVRSLSVDLQQAAGGIIIVPPAGLDEKFRFQVGAPTNRIEGNGTLAISFDFWYTLPNGGREALATLVFSIADDAGAQSQVTAQAKIR
jgi:hypothetical protein